MVVRLTNSESKILQGPLPEDDPMRRCPDIGRAREVLGWEPRTPAREGLKTTINWFAHRSDESSLPSGGMSATALESNEPPNSYGSTVRLHSAAQQRG
jgi:hypothetical protein